MLAAIEHTCVWAEVSCFWNSWGVREVCLLCVASGLQRTAFDQGLRQAQGIRLAARTIERASDRAAERATERLSDRATERLSDRATERPGDRATERRSDRATERPSDRATERSPTGHSLGTRWSFETVTSAFCKTFQNSEF